MHRHVESIASSFASIRDRLLKLNVKGSLFSRIAKGMRIEAWTSPTGIASLIESLTAFGTPFCKAAEQEGEDSGEGLRQEEASDKSHSGHSYGLGEARHCFESPSRKGTLLGAKLEDMDLPVPLFGELDDHLRTPLIANKTGSTEALPTTVVKQEYVDLAEQGAAGPDVASESA